MNHSAVHLKYHKSTTSIKIFFKECISHISHNILKNDRDRIASFSSIKGKSFENAQWKNSSEGEY